MPARSPWSICLLRFFYITFSRSFIGIYLNGFRRNDFEFPSRIFVTLIYRNQRRLTRDEERISILIAVYKLDSLNLNSKKYLQKSFTLFN